MINELSISLPTLNDKIPDWVSVASIEICRLLKFDSSAITILGSSIGGTNVDDDVIVTVTGISINPSVYETYTCQIFERQGGDNRLSYYDGSDVLNIKNINE